MPTIVPTFTSGAFDAPEVKSHIKTLAAAAALPKPATPSTAQMVVLNPDGTATTQAIPNPSPTVVAPGLVDITSGVAGVTSVATGLVQIGS